MIHYYVRNFLQWFCRVTRQQCSGKRRHGFANEYCQKTAFHKDTCVAGDGSLFEAVPRP